jgi:hypothetical protein
MKILVDRLAVRPAPIVCVGRNDAWSSAWIALAEMLLGLTGVNVLLSLQAVRPARRHNTVVLERQRDKALGQILLELDVHRLTGISVT